MALEYTLWVIDDGLGSLLESHHGMPKSGHTPLFFQTKAGALDWLKFDMCKPERLYANIPKPWPKPKPRRVKVTIR